MNCTIPQMLVALARRRAGRPALRHREGGGYRDLSWTDLETIVHGFGRGLLQLGLACGDRVAIMAPNGPDWVFADLGTMTAGALSVSIYHTEGLPSVLHILKDSGSRFLFTHSPEMAARILDRSEELPHLQRVILLQGSLDHAQVLSRREFLAGGEAVSAAVLQKRLDAGSAADAATLIYTSGTTGFPKGVQLTHGSILANLGDCGQLFDIGPDDVCLSFLPLSHVFERVDGYYFMLNRGAVIAYAESLEAVAANMLEIRPTVMISVPRLYEKVYARVLEKVQAGSWFRRQIFAAALLVGRSAARRGLAGRRSGMLLRTAAALARHLVFSRMQEGLGGRLRFFISGGAPLSPAIAEFFLAAEISIYEGYGLTESAGGIAVNTPQARRLGTVGKPFPGVAVRIDADGEILLRGPAIFSGYWKRPEETAEAFTADGWFRTGDLGRIDEDGYLAITDRKKDLIVTAGGENIAPQYLENLFKTDAFIDKALVFGDRKPYLTALIIPNLERLEAFARENALPCADACALVKHPAVLRLFRARIDRLQENLASFQRIKRFTLLSGDFHRREITPTLKIRRNLVYDHYRQVLEEMYQPIGHGFHDNGFCIVEELSGDERS